MTDPQLPAADDLGRSYQQLLENRAWEVDVDAPVGSVVPESANEPPPEPPRSPKPQAAVEPPPAHRIVEAMLFVGGVSLSPEQAGDVIRGLTSSQFQEAVDTLNRSYRDQGRPYLIQKQGTGYLLTLRPTFRSIAGKLYGGVREARLSPAAVDALAVVAYRQPVSKDEIDSVRGQESGALVRHLVRRGLIAVVSRAESGGRDVQYGTAPRFLELFGLTSLEDLPQTEDLQRL